MSGLQPRRTQLRAAANACALRGEWRRAALLLRQVYAADRNDPAVRHALALALMAQGNLREGLPLYAQRASVPGLGIAKPRFPVPEWQGEGLSGRHIVVFPEQGLGDQIMFARYLPILRKAAGDVTVITMPPLLELFRQFGVRVLAAQGAMEFPEPDAWCLIGDLPLRLGRFDISGAPYLKASPSRAGGVGLVRRGNPKHPNDANRSMPSSVAVPFPTIDLSPEHTGAKTMLETAAIVAGLDAVVTVDTSIAHLAGAMGVRTYILIPHTAPDWRWGEEGQETRWYDSARTVRLGPGRDWQAALETVRAELG